MIITSPYVDLRRQPIAQSKEGGCDPLQETQLLFGEEVKIHYQRGSWIYVEALDQMRWQEGWQGYCGWIEEGHIGEGSAPNATVGAIRAGLYQEPRGDSLPCGRLWLGMRLHVLSDEGEFVKVALPDRPAYCRKEVLTLQDPSQAAKAWIGTPYLWGKLLPPGVGTDCSGLVHLAYRTAGHKMPRNSTDQYKACTPCAPSELERGDLVFMAKRADPRAISHVLLYDEEDLMVETAYGVGKGRSVTGKERFGFPLLELSEGKKYNNYFLFFGKAKFFSSKSPY